MATRLVITGRVQGVFYRDWTVATAGRLGVAGWVRNRQDGSVEAHAEGEPDAVAAFVTACRSGPDGARVDATEVFETDDAGCVGFARCATA